jgi:hypothetical protein
MSRAFVRSPECGARGAFEEAAVLIPRVMIGTLERSTDLMLRAGRMMNALLPKVTLSSLMDPCCEVPEKECPPRCVCEVLWDACQGETVAPDSRSSCRCPSPYPSPMPLARSTVRS